MQICLDDFQETAHFVRVKTYLLVDFISFELEIQFTSLNLGPTKFDATQEHDTNPTRFLRVWVEYNHVWVIFVLTRLTRLINGSYSC